MLDAAHAFLHARVSWETFQVVAVVVGTVIVGRALGRRGLAAMAAGLVLAVVFGVTMGCGLRWAHGDYVEVAGSGAMTGLVVGFLGFYRVASVRELPKATAVLALAIPPMIVLARLGCFSAGCDYGAPTHLPWALEGRHPTQLYEAMLGVTLGIVAVLMPPRRRLAAVVFGYAAGRFGIDFVRGDLAHGALDLTTTQWLAFTLVGFACILHAFGTRFRKRAHCTE